MGFFTRNTMTLDDMAELVAFVASSVLRGYHDYHAWPDDRYRTDATNAWLSRTGHRASFMKLTKLATCGDAVARHVSANVPTAPIQLFGDDEETRQEMREGLIDSSREILLTKGIVN